MSLPPSDDKEFWGENEIEVVDVPTPKVEETHYLVWRGPFAVCTSCPYEHTIPVDPKKYDIKNGVLVKKQDNVLN